MAKLDKLKRLMCSSSEGLLVNPGARYPQTLRPANNPFDDILTRVAGKVQAAIPRGMHQHLRPQRVFKAVGGILYDQEWTGNPIQSMNTDHITPDDELARTAVQSACNYAFEIMLLVDYGLLPYPVQKPSFFNTIWTQFEHFSHLLISVAYRWNQGQFPDQAAYDRISHVMCSFDGNGVDVWDAATLIYYYHTRREPVDNGSANKGRAGYTGVLQEMISEASKRGTDRLARKLSLDINLLIPKFVSDRERRELMLYKARRLVQEYRLSILDTGTVGNWFSFDTVAKKEKQL
ncbi:hypothetical protein F5144DRAFT_551009 [Chaetomium tenue]|uniref:Uncharacterized protein n=1 Tax=Chaetomium tenue TaxID=1854479 RepID=A0ACB7NYY3_9PEZI|nr:hypothetical protein F5144DRAFT_551009 [Chaetomium globosum]